MSQYLACTSPISLDVLASELQGSAFLVLGLKVCTLGLAFVCACLNVGFEVHPQVLVFA